MNPAAILLGILLAGLLTVMLVWSGVELWMWWDWRRDCNRAEAATRARNRTTLGDKWLEHQKSRFKSL